MKQNRRGIHGRSLVVIRRSFVGIACEAILLVGEEPIKEGVRVRWLSIRGP